MTMPSNDAAGPEPVPVPVRVVLPADPLLGTDQQEVVAQLWKRQQTETGWVEDYLLAPFGVHPANIGRAPNTIQTAVAARKPPGP
ncbi:hypothetical protein [Streptomyces flaveolus]|uniref:hypothetical protein n=1 Tax=Streptomyces flaveolus TaxID=67297 RepID=UPI0036FEABD3